MRNVTIKKALNRIDALDDRLREVFGSNMIGLSYDGENLTVHLEDEADEQVAVTEVENYDINTKSVRQQREELMDLARTELLTSDFKTLRDAINNASTLAALRPILRGMLLVMWRMALAQGLTHETDVNNT